MDEFILKEIKNADILVELGAIGFDKTYREKAADKFKFKNIKIFDLTIAQANILKQTALSVGADCGVHRDVLTAKIDKTDCILGGSFSQLKKIAKKLEGQPFKMVKLAKMIEAQLDFELAPMLGFDFKRPYVVGVLNLTSNSFSDGGDFVEFENACDRLLEMVEDGVDVIELGAESTKPFSEGISAEMQLDKLIPMLKFVADKGIKTPISVDTRSSEVAKCCIELGARIINDVSGLEFDPNLVEVLGATPVVIQHSKGNPQDMQISPEYENLMDEIFLDLRKRVDFARSKGVENIIIDAGIGFGKIKEHNFEILRRVEELKSLNYPVMIGLSRKSLLDMKNETNETKDIYTLALNARLLGKVNFIRVHNTKLHTRLIKLLASGG